MSQHQTAGSQRAQDYLMAQQGLDLRDGDRLPWKAWERAVYKPAWRLTALSWAMGTAGVLAGLYQYDAYLIATMALSLAALPMFLSLGCALGRASRLMHIIRAENPPPRRYRHVCPTPCPEHRKDRP